MPLAPIDEELDDRIGTDLPLLEARDPGRRISEREFPWRAERDEAFLFEFRDGNRMDLREFLDELVPDGVGFCSRLGRREVRATGHLLHHEADRRLAVAVDLRHEDPVSLQSPEAGVFVRDRVFVALLDPTTPKADRPDLPGRRLDVDPEDRAPAGLSFRADDPAADGGLDDLEGRPPFGSEGIEIKAHERTSTPVSGARLLR